MKQTHVCPKCSANEVIYVPRIRDSQQSTLALHVEPGWVETTLHGRVEAYVCAACGFTELYAVDPALIPLDQIPGAKRLGPVPRPPYR
jgi:predicted RNA-binding Zn-ribbon protein involved in translation (DUF1610 family)